MNLSFPEASPGLRGKALDQFWQRHFQAPLLPPESTLEHRLMVGWRLVRAHAMGKGLLSEDETLEEALGLTVMNNSRSTGASVWDWPSSGKEENTLMALRPIPIVPPNEQSPEMCVAAFNSDQFCAAYMELARMMEIPRGSEQFPDYGQLGLLMLKHPEIVHEAFPSRSLLVDFEERLIEQCAGLLVTSSSSSFGRTLKRQFGLNRTEIRSLKRLAMRTLAQDHAAEIEERRAMMCGRLENLAERARESFDLKAELGALKTMSIIQGLSANKPEDEVGDFVKVVASSSAKELDYTQDEPESDLEEVD